MNSITVVIGVRRSGKTSLLRVAFNECKNPHVYVDPRFSTALDYRDFAVMLKNSLEIAGKLAGDVVDIILIHETPYLPNLFSFIRESIDSPALIPARQ
jgi:AAA+ ATPase superfamily predicted ATPase